MIYNTENDKIIGSLNSPKILYGNIKKENDIHSQLSSGQEGTSNYERLYNKPLINDVVLIGNQKPHQLKLQPEMDVLTNSEIQQIIKL